MTELFLSACEYVAGEITHRYVCATAQRVTYIFRRNYYIKVSPATTIQRGNGEERRCTAHFLSSPEHVVLQKTEACKNKRKR